VFGGDAFERKKPDPLPLIKTCEALGTLPARTLMVTAVRLNEPWQAVEQALAWVCGRFHLVPI
jgi:hypothetical protein